MPGATHRYINIDDVDLMIYTGHGYAKNRNEEEIFTSNSLHFGRTDTGKEHSWGNGTASSVNFTTEDAKYFGYNAKTKWLVAYTCNFLNTAQGDTNVTKMLDRGGRLILGLGTKAYISPNEGEDFGKYLNAGDTFREAFYKAAEKNQDLGPDPKKNNRNAKKYKILYYGTAENNTLSDSLKKPLAKIQRENAQLDERAVNKYNFNDFEES